MTNRTDARRRLEEYRAAADSLEVARRMVAAGCDPSACELTEREIRLDDVSDRCEEVLDECSKVAAPWVADALRLHYLQGMTWEQAAEIVAYSEQHVRRCTTAALDAVGRARRARETRP